MDGIGGDTATVTKRRQFELNVDDCVDVFVPGPPMPAAAVDVLVESQSLEWSFDSLRSSSSDEGPVSESEQVRWEASEIEYDDRSEEVHGYATVSGTVHLELDVERSHAHVDKKMVRLVIVTLFTIISRLVLLL